MNFYKKFKKLKQINFKFIKLKKKKKFYPIT